MASTAFIFPNNSIITFDFLYSADADTISYQNNKYKVALVEDTIVFYNSELRLQRNIRLIES